MWRDPQLAEAAAAEGLALAKTHSLARPVDGFSVSLAWARAQLGDAEQSVSDMRESIARLMADGRRGSAGDSLFRLAHVLNVTGALADALNLVEQFLTDFPDNVLVRPSGLERDFREAISSARKIGTKPPELRAATSLARLFRQRGDISGARNLLAPLYAQFTQGFDTRDVKDAKALLNELA